jgi:N-methylhydantoinase A
MESVALDDLESPEFARRADLRYRGQSFELTVDAGDFDALEAHWHDVHEQRYGYRMESEPVEIVNLRVTATVAADKPELKEDAGDRDPEASTRDANFDGDWTEVSVLERARMGRGAEVEGPCLVELKEATCVVRLGWRGAVDEVGTLVLDRQ